MHPKRTELLSIIDKMLTEAQTIRINQVQMCVEFKWPQGCKDNCDKAWDQLNLLAKRALSNAPEEN